MSEVFALPNERKIYLKFIVHGSQYTKRNVYGKIAVGGVGIHVVNTCSVEITDILYVSVNAISQSSQVGNLFYNFLFYIDPDEPKDIIRFRGYSDDNRIQDTSFV